MHLRAAVVLAASAASAALLAPQAAATAPPPANAAAPPADRAPVCGSSAQAGFPINSRLFGGPSGYPPGLVSSPFSLELTNTTSGDCRDVHPLVILVDRDGRLTPRQFALRYAPPGGGWRAVPFQTTDRRENIGIPGGQNGPGLTVPAGRSVTVRLQLWFAPGTPADRVVLSATTMQRRGADGAWVAESNHYAFDVVPPPPVLADTGATARDRAVPAGLAGLAAGLVALGAALVAAARRRGPARRRRAGGGAGGFVPRP